MRSSSSLGGISVRVCFLHRIFSLAASWEIKVRTVPLHDSKQYLQMRKSNGLQSYIFSQLNLSLVVESVSINPMFHFDRGFKHQTAPTFCYWWPHEQLPC